MKLLHAILAVDRPADENNWAFNAPCEAICESLSITGVWMFNDKIDAELKAYPVYKWMCTDEHVGLDALWLGDTAVAAIYRPARKSDYTIKWVSEEAATKVRDFILANTDDERTKPDLIGLDEDIGDDFAVPHVSQALTDDGFFEGRPVKALIWYDGLMGRTTPVEYRQEGRSYFVKVAYQDEKSNCVLVQDGDAQRVIPVEDFRMALSLDPVLKKEMGLK